jgi:hypothetical protein
MARITDQAGPVIDSPGFVGEVSLDGSAWQEVCRAPTHEACLDLLFKYEPPAGTIAVERRALPERRGDESTVR